MNGATSGMLLPGAIMALALMCFLTITANSSSAAGTGIYEVEASNLAYSELLGTDPAASKKLFDPREGR